LLRVLVLVALIAAIVLFARGQRGDHMRILEAPKGSIGSLEGDRQVLAQLRRAGADLTKPTEINFYLYFKDREAADSAAAHVSAGPLIATVRPPLSDGKPWLCDVTDQMVPDETAIHSQAVRFLELAQRYGGEYDGWEAAVRK
jgi:regulator of RNase E activity RraB